MERHRSAGDAPKTTHLSKRIGRIGGCIDCSDCKGICQALIEMMILPDAVLNKGAGQ